MPPSTHNPEAVARRGHEVFDLDARYIGWFTVGIVILLFATAIAAFAMLGGFRVPPPPRDAAPHSDSPTAPPVPALQSAPAEDLRVYRRDKASMLEGYRWLDRASGIVQLPIERAMQLAAERGAQRPESAGDRGPRR
jgi:hypothetical protein